ncbi:stalk domain-containing protein [Caldisalinibacter kiritimatiensis]|uniref:Copper amine oxidase-like protein n=1 Tax=Caldisalinibacter kiritimatiensis TaxID=1304284 RepID=R1CFM8_9FIRM|nr:stalk domain-containing protein [Caldisalinibacter kiritimatiensis]EOD01110.1 copper amine oxidase-like protein [Caldisalinibacter kiritimatiensis]
MKKLLTLLSALIILNLLIIKPIYAQLPNDIKVTIDGEEVEFDVPPTIINGRTLVPVRAIFETLGAKVKWDGETRTVIGTKGDISINLQIDNTNVMVNDKIIELDVPATIIDGRTLVPARFVADSLGAQVGWNGETRTVIITTYNKITNGEYITNLVKMLEWDIAEETDEKTEELTTKKALEIAIQHGLPIDRDIKCSKFITKEEVELMFIRAMGFDTLTNKITYLENPLKDKVAENHIQEIILDMYKKIKEPLNEMHGFYAIRSYSQRDLIEDFNAVSYGWSCLEFNEEKQKVQLKTDKTKNNAFYLPNGFEEVIEIANDNNVSINLMVFASNQSNKSEDNVGLVERIITSPEIRKDVISQIVKSVNKLKYKSKTISFDGVVIDFEQIKDIELANHFNTFLNELKMELDKNHKKLHVAVQPGYYYKGYDYKTIGQIADKVILMAHDYYVNDVEKLIKSNVEENFYDIKNPLTPIENIYNEGFDVYNALKEITNKNTGIKDKNKIMLQLSFDAVQIQKDSKGNIEFFSPTYEQIKDRLLNEETQDSLEMKYDKASENPYFTYFDEGSNKQNIIWYEDTRSVLTKVNLAKLFCIKNISIWRLGNIPDYDKDLFLNIWEQTLNLQEGK